MSRLTDRIKHAVWNVFRFEDENYQRIVTSQELGPGYSHRPDRPYFRWSNEKTTAAAIYLRMAIDVASVPLRHIRQDKNKQYQEDITSGINECLTIEANIDQGGRMFRQDMAQTLFEEGVIAIVPVETTLNPMFTGAFDVTNMRVGRVMQWYPRHVKVRLYNEQRGVQEDIILSKKLAAIVENPLYSVMNEPNSTLQRLIRKLALLDAVDEQSASGKLDLIIQLPFTVRTDLRRAEAAKRIKEIEFQLKGSQHGIAYADATEKVVQLNRPSENNLLGQVEYLTKMLYSELGLTEEVMKGTADEPTMINYYNRSIEPVLAAISEAMARVFLTKTGRSQGQTITYIRDAFKLVPVKELAEIADKFTRNEILTSNEVRSIVGFRPSDDERADKLQNKNIPAPAGGTSGNGAGTKVLTAIPRQALPLGPPTPQGANNQNGT